MVFVRLRPGTHAYGTYRVHVQIFAKAMPDAFEKQAKAAGQGQPLTDVYPQELVAQLAKFCEDSGWEELQAAAELRRFRAYCELVHTGLLPFAQNVCYALVVCLKTWGHSPRVMDEAWRTAECVSCMLGHCVGGPLLKPYAEALLQQPVWPLRCVKSLRRMVACSGLTLPMPQRLRLEYQVLRHAFPLLDTPALTAAGAKHLAELLKLLTASVALEPFLRQSPYLACALRALQYGASHSDARVRQVSGRAAHTVTCIAHPHGHAIAELAPGTLGDMLEALPVPDAARA